MSEERAGGYGNPERKDKHAHVISFLSHSSRLHFNERRKEGGGASGGRKRESEGMGREGVERWMADGRRARSARRKVVARLRSVWQWVLKFIELMG